MSSFDSQFPDVIRCSQHFYYLSKIQDSVAIYINNIPNINRYAIVSDQILGC